MNDDDDVLLRHWNTVVGFCTSIRGHRLPENLTSIAARDDEDRLEHVNLEAAGDKGKDAIVVATKWYGEAYQKLLLAWACAKQYTNLVARDPGNGERFIRCATGVADWFMTHHQVVRRIITPRASEIIVKLVSGSWRCTMQSLLLVRALEACRDDGGQFDGWTMFLAEKAHEMTYPQALIRAKRGNIIISTRAIGFYSVNEWSVAFESLMDAMYKSGWTPGARHYLSALVARYAALLRGDEADIQKGRACYDNGTLCIRPTGLATRLIPLPGLLGDAFVIEMERKLFHAMRHSSAAYAFYRQGKLLQHSVRWRRRALAALAAFITAIDKEKSLHVTLVENVRNALMGRQILPGEYEQSLYLGQGAGAVSTNTRGEPDMVLFDLRRDEFMALQPLQTASMAELVDLWVSSYHVTEAEEAETETADAWWEYAACRRANRERIALLVLQHALDIDLGAKGFSFTRQSHVDDSSEAPPYDAPRPSPMDTVRNFQGRVPIFVAISHLYAIVDDARHADDDDDAMDIDDDDATPTYMTYVTPHLPDALALWLERAVANGCLEPDQIHSALMPLLSEED